MIANILNARYWPPSTRVVYDDFEELFHGLGGSGEAFSELIANGGKLEGQS